MLSQRAIEIRSHIPLLDLKASYESLRVALMDAADSVFQSGVYINGPQVAALEQEMAAFLNVPYAIGVASGTDALLLTLDALGIGAGDEVITTPYTFFATAEAISRLGAVPIFVDVDPDTCLMDVNRIEERITDRTKAIIPVHLFGQTVDMNHLEEIALKYGLSIIEDACQALGASFEGKKAGSMGKAGCFSFFPTKNLGGFGDGGMVVTHDPDLALKLQRLRVHGSNPKYYHAMLGYNSRLDELQAALLRVKLTKLEEWTSVRQAKAAYYMEALSELPIQLPKVMPYGEHGFHLFVIETDARQELMSYMAEHGIDTGIYYPVPLHLQEVYRPLGYKPHDLPHAERAASRAMAIPLYPELTDDEQHYIVDTIYTFYKRKEMSL